MENLLINKEIEQAFAWRALPEQVAAPSRWANDDDHDEALYFLGRDWRTLSRAEWGAKSSAIYHFLPAAFAYYLRQHVGALGGLGAVEPGNARRRDPTGDCWR